MRNMLQNTSSVPFLIITNYGQRVTTNRLAEAMWFSFDPIVGSPYYWWIDVLGFPVSPYEVVINGSQHLHAFETGCFVCRRSSFISN
jgi:hypothetical protein